MIILLAMVLYWLKNEYGIDAPWYVDSTAAFLIGVRAVSFYYRMEDSLNIEQIKTRVLGQ